MKSLSSGRALLAFRLIAPVLSLLLALILAEVALRLFSREVKNYTRIQRQREIARTESIWMQSPDPVLIYEHRPEYRKNGTIYTNSDGILRAEEVSRAKPESLFRIIVLGDSVAAGLDLERSGVFPAVLESLLSSSEAFADRSVEVLNFAVNGYRSTQEARLLEVRGAEFSPDLVILQYCLNDAGNSLTPTIWFQKQTTYRSHVIRRLVKALKPLVLSTDPNESFYVPRFGAEYGSTDYWFRLYDERSTSWRSVVASFERIARYAEEREIPAIVAIFPLLVEPAWRLASVAPFHRQVAEAAADAGLDVIDLLDEFARYDVSALRLRRGDIYHFNELGQRLAAEALFERLVAVRSAGSPEGPG